MSSDINLISIENVSKLFYKQEQRTFKELLPALFLGKRTGQWFWALQDINVQIKKGEVVGITGPNGSGKSTLLKLVSGVTNPTKGNIEVKGRIAPLIELGAGFHPELSGRENIYLNGVIMGMKRKEIESKFKQIVDFAELWEFIDQPIKHYSSGMYLRLAFSVAVHTDPDIFIVDEILAVGDVEFQKKCFKKIDQYLKQGGTLLLVSHDMVLINKLCTKILTLEHGKIIDVKDNSRHRN